MKIAALARRAMPVVPGRAGVPPVWDRPDPPASAKPPIRQHRMTMEQSHNYFFDAASPIYNVVNSEVAEGDLLEALPSLLKRLLVAFGLAFVVGSAGFLYASKATIKLPMSFEMSVSELEKIDRNFESKYGLQELKKNPWKLNVWPEFWPHVSWGKLQKPYNYEFEKYSLDTIRKINSEGRNYWNKLRQESKHEIANGTETHH